MQDAGGDARPAVELQGLLDAPPASQVRRVAIQQRLSLLIYGGSLVIAVLWSVLAPGAVQPVPRVLERLVIVLLVALGGLGWALETRRLDSVVQRVRADVFEQLALSDDLTGLRNRRGFFQQLQQEWVRYVRYQRPFAVVLLDLDHFKQVNDLYGHATGDRSLQLLARHLRRSLRAGDVASRLGGDEFALILPETSTEAADAVLERIRSSVQADRSLVHEESGATVQLRVSGGIAVPDVQTQEAEDVLRRADTELYARKAARDRAGDESGGTRS